MCETHDHGTAQRLGKRHHERRRPFCIGRATLQVKQTSKQAIHHVQRLFILHSGLPARKALEKHQLRGCSASEVKQGPSLGRSQTTSFTPSARRWSQPRVRKELSDSLYDRPETELSNLLSSDCGQAMPVFARPKLQHSRSDAVSSQTLSRREEGCSADADDSHLTCGCGFTCGTPSAMDRHQKRCGLDVRSAPASPAAVDKTAFDVQLRKRFGSERSAPVVDEAACSRNVGLLSPPVEAEGKTRSSLRFLLVRHGESANRGSTSKCPDPALSTKGQRQAEALADRLTGEMQKVAAAGDLQIWCSPMLRCLQTIKPTMDVLDLPKSKCICHGACYEHGCAGLSFEGTPAAIIEERFPNFQFAGFNSRSLWDYSGSNDKETSEECISRAWRIVEWLRPKLKEAMNCSTSSPVVILVLHQTLGDLLLQLLLHGTSNSWTYGDPKYKPLGSRGRNVLHMRCVMFC
ncbi:unnamed protein product [Symbiodinium microadriaticum]|nr:unnamed protein product [Symbiodinium microadriaticum]